MLPCKFRFLVRNRANYPQCDQIKKGDRQNRARCKNEEVILSILVDTFISKISLPMQPVPEIGSISVA